MLILLRSTISAHSPAATRLFFALSVPLWMRSRWLGAAAAVWTLLAICLPLLYLGYHWPSDIVAGAVVGVALMLLLCRLIGATGLPDRVVRFSATHPPAFYAIAWLFALEIAVLFGDVRGFLSRRSTSCKSAPFVSPPHEKGNSSFAL